LRKFTMPLDPQVRTYLDTLAAANLPPVETLTPEEARRQMIVASVALGPAEAVYAVEDRWIDGAADKLPVRIYRPSGARPLPVLVYFHGGGWVVGSVATHDGYCRALSNAAGVAIVSVDYRLAPEHCFPAAAEDAYAATKAIASLAAELGLDPQRLAVGGDSAGGNLAAAVALMARDRSGPSLAMQLLIYPVTDAACDTPSSRENAAGYGLTSTAMQWFWRQYAPQAEDQAHPYAAPLRAADLRHLPPAVILTAEYDPLRDEAEDYAHRLEAASVRVKLTRYDGMIHGFVRRLVQFDRAREALADTAAALRQGLAAD
jgi:acetyl esterase